MATRADVARLAGVSPSTVTYVLNGQRSVTARTKARVKAAMRELNYVPNAFARGLAGSHRGLLALHFPTDVHGFTPTEFAYVSAATDHARKLGYQLLLWTNRITDVEELHALLGQSIVDGVLLMEVVAEDPRLEVLRDSGVPFVTIGRPDDARGISFVDSDYRAMLRLAVDYLADLGHRSLVVLGQSTANLERGAGPTRRITDAVEEPARSRGMAVTPINVEFSSAGGAEAFRRLLLLHPQPTAVVAYNELAVPGLIGAATAEGFLIPDQLSVLAIGLSVLSAESCTPELTTVTPPISRIAQRAVEILAGAIRKKSSEQVHELMDPSLTVRASTCEPRRPADPHASASAASRSADLRPDGVEGLRPSGPQCR